MTPSLSKLNFDPINDITPVIQLSQGPFRVVVHPSLPLKNIKELIALAKAKPGQLTFASSGAGSITQLATDRANIGSNIETLGYYNDQLGTLKNNLSAANSRIVDVDVAQESTRYAKYNILVQAGTAMLAQANAQPQSALRLLQYGVTDRIAP